MNNIIVLCWPSGSWKDTIRKILEDKYLYRNLLSTTSRDKRNWEKDWIDYNFISKEEFKKWISNNEFLEYSLFNDNYYWKSNKILSKTLELKNDIVAIVETEWVISFSKLKSFFLEKWYTINIVFLDISEETIKERMLKRGDNIKDIEKRLKNNDYDYFQKIKNDYADIVINSNWIPENITDEITSKVNKKNNS